MSRKTTRRALPRRLDLVRLEERTVPTTFAMVEDYAAGAAGSNPYPLVPFRDQVVTIRQANGIANLDAIGPTGTTRLLSGIDQNPNAGGFVELDGTLYFPARVAGQGYQLFATDGSSTAIPVTALNTGSTWGLFPQELTVHDGTLYFVGQNGAGTALYSFDGSTASIVAGFNQANDPGSFWNNNPHNLHSAGGLLYFNAADNDPGDGSSGHGSEPWVSDGTPGGTAMLTDLNPGNANSNPREYVEFGGNVWFTAIDPTRGRTLFYTDGTEDGTNEGGRILPANSNPAWLTPFNGRLYFAANTSSEGRELWSSTSNLFFVRSDLNPNGDSSPEGLTVAGDKLFFRADNGAGTGFQLFVAKTTGSPTVLPINTSTSPFTTTAGDDFHVYEQFAVAGDRIVFPANDGSTGLEPWVSDGTADGTVRLADLNPNGDSFLLYSVTSQKAVTAGDVTYFAASDGSNGVELWAGDVVPPSPPPPSTDTRVTTRLNVDVNPVAVNQPVVITAEFVSPAGIPQGHVSFFANQSLIGSPRIVIVNGRASVTTSFSIENPQTLTAAYYPDDPWLVGLDTPLSSVSLIVGAGVQTTTEITGVSAASVRSGDSFTVSAQVTPASGTLPGGTVRVFVGASQLGDPVQVDSEGRVQVTGSVTGPAGTYPVTALYSGSGNFVNSRALDGPDLTLLQPPPPALAPTTLTLTGPDTVKFYEDIELRLSLASDAKTPSGISYYTEDAIFFANGVRIAATAVLGSDASTAATLVFDVQTLNVLPGDTITFSAEYPGDETYARATSNALQVRATGRLANYIATVDPIPAVAVRGASFPVAVQAKLVVGSEVDTENTDGFSVVVRVDGGLYSVVTPVHGVANLQIDTRDLTPGRHEIDAVFFPVHIVDGAFELDGLAELLALSAIFEAPFSLPRAFVVQPPAQVLPPATGGGRRSVLAAGDPPQIVFLNFNGGSVRNIPSADTITELPRFEAADLGFADGERDVVIAAIVRDLQSLYAGYNISFTTTRPTSDAGPFMSMTIGGTNDAVVGQFKFDATGNVIGQVGDFTTYRAITGLVADLTVFGQAFGRNGQPDLGNAILDDLGVVFSGVFANFYGAGGDAGTNETRDALRGRMVISLAHEIGHNLGLRHLTNQVTDASGRLVANASVMAQNSPRPPSSTFQDLVIALAEQRDEFGNPKWADGATQDNSAATLRANLSSTRPFAAGGGTGGATARDMSTPLMLDLGSLPAGLTEVIVEIGVDFDADASNHLVGGFPIVSQQIVLQPGQTRVPLNLPNIAARPQIAIRGTSASGGPIDVFSGTDPDDRNANFVDLIGVDGTPLLIHLSLRGADGSIQSFGDVVSALRLGFVHREDGDPSEAQTRYAVGAGPGGLPLVSIIDARNGQSYTSFSAFEETFTGGVAVTQRDVNGDGVPEIIVAAGLGGAPRVRVFDGVTYLPIGGPLADFFAYEESFRGGVSVAVGDVNGDGYEDVVVGAGSGGGPRVRVFSGKDGSVIADFFAYEESFRGGVSVSVADLDGDGMADIAVGAGAGGGPHVRVFSGAGGSVLMNYFAFDPSFRGGVNVAFGDVNGDGRPDIVVGAGIGGGPVVQVFSGMDGTLLSSRFVFDADSRTGVRVGTARTADDATNASIVAASGPGNEPRVKVYDALSGLESDDGLVFDAEFLGGLYLG